MYTQQEIFAAAKASIERFNASLSSGWEYDVKKAKTLTEANGARRVGRFLKLYIRHKRADGKKTAFNSELIHEFSSTELDPDEATIKLAEAQLAGSPVPTAPAVPDGSAVGTTTPQVIVPVSTPIQTPPPISTPVAPPLAPGPVTTPTPVAAPVAQPAPIVAPPAPPPPPAPLPALGTIGNPFKVGSWVQVFNTGGVGLRLRADHTINSAIVITVPDGTTGEINFPAQMQDGFTWYGVIIAGRSGWMAGEFLKQF